MLGSSGRVSVDLHHEMGLRCLRWNDFTGASSGWMHIFVAQEPVVSFASGQTVEVVDVFRRLNFGWTLDSTFLLSMIQGMYSLALHDSLDLVIC